MAINLKDLVIVSGMPGVFRLVANRNNGLIVEDMDSGKRRFAPARVHQFTPLESITIFTEDDEGITLSEVFESMLSKLEGTPPPEPNSDNASLRKYFTEVAPSHDPERVRISDIRKILRWFHFLHARDLLQPEPDTPAGEEEE